MFQCYFNDTVFGKIIFSDISHHITYRSRERGGRVLDSKKRGPGFDPHRLHRVVSLSKTLQYWLNPS